MPINTGTHPKLLWPGVHAIWGQVYNEHAKEYPDLFDIETSDQAYEQDVKVTGFSSAPLKSEGGTVHYDKEIQGQIATYTHLAYALGYIVTKEELMDNKYEIVATRRAKANAFAMNVTVENVAAAVYNNAFSGSYPVADGVSLLNTAHVNASGGTYSNVLSPGADISEAALEDISVQIMGSLDDRGNQINIMPRSLHVSIHDWYTANRVLKSVLQPDSVSNNINVLNATNAFPGGIKMNHYFTAAHAWFVRTDCQNGMMMFWRAQPEFEQDNDFDTKNAKASSYMRFSVGNTDPLGLFGSNGP